jgi:L,D-peptidoglycan transpeptidase YkuD (ErfK/YbiS/YcfS/YnhG family)
LALTLVLVRPWLGGWDEPPLARREAALQAYAAAGSTSTRAYAPGELIQAEKKLAAATLAEARQLDRWPSTRRDFRLAAVAYDAAKAAADHAVLVGAERATTARDEVRSLLGLAETAYATTERVSKQMPFPRQARINLRKARTDLLESRLLLGQESYVRAAAAASSSLAAAEAVRKAVLPSTARFADPDQIRTWRAWIAETIAWSKEKRKPAIVIYKEKHLLVLYDAGRAIGAYDADLGRNSLQPKRHAGDKATPEGRYHITAKKQNGATVYYRALMLDYPNAEDRARFAKARRDGRVPEGTGPGLNIEIHGHGGRHEDWTLGCVALADADIDAVFAKVADGTPVTIVGGDGKDGIYSSLWQEHGPGGSTP